MALLDFYWILHSGYNANIRVYPLHVDRSSLWPILDKGKDRCLILYIRQCPGQAE